MEFIHTARELQIYTIQKCAHFPKRYTFYLSQPIATSAGRVHQYVKAANSVYPTNAHEAQLRRDYLLWANAELQSLISQIEVACEAFGIEANSMRHWMELIDNEIRLVKGVLKADRSRYKGVLEKSGSGETLPEET